MVIRQAWGMLTRDEHAAVQLTDARAAAAVVTSSAPGIPFGLGRSYGDVCLNPDGTLWETAGMDRMIAFDEQHGLLTVEAGVTLRDIQRTFMRRGWSLPVTPGTLQVTVGGAIANDIHGKSHHIHGTFGHNVVELTLARTTGEVITCGPDVKAPWFNATVGGIGLTGLITTATLQLRQIPSPWIDSETVPFTGVDAFMQLSDETDEGWEHAVAWIDCLAGAEPRGLFMRGNAAEDPGRPDPRSLPLAVPLTPPISLVNRLSLRPFNAAYMALGKRKAGRHLEHYSSFLSPLDAIADWNRVYGPKGFYQYQSVIPPQHAAEATRAMLGEIAASGEGSFLAVLKRFGSRPSIGMLSFPRPGVTLALDFPNHGRSTERLFERLDRIVRDAEGVLYLAKDARMPREMFEAGYPRLREFQQYRDPGMSSAMSRRLLDEQRRPT